MTTQHEKLDYVEWGACDLAATQKFFIEAFDWSFAHYGPEYMAFANQGLNGGFYKSAQASTTATGGALLVFYSADLEATLAKVEAAGGQIVKPTFTFPGGRRFHFCEPSGNEFAVWSDFKAATEV